MHAETVGLSCEVTSRLEPMTAAAQAESVFRETASQSLSGEVTACVVSITAAAQVESALLEDVSQSVGATDGSAPITAENMHVETVSLSGVVTVSLVSMIAEEQVVSPILRTTDSRMLIAPVGESENVVQTCAKVDSLKTGATADMESTEDEAAGQDCSKTGIASNKRKARQDALKRKQRRAKLQRLRMTGDVATQEGEGIKDRDDRTSRVWP